MKERWDIIQRSWSVTAVNVVVWHLFDTSPPQRTARPFMQKRTAVTDCSSLRSPTETFTDSTRCASHWHYDRPVSATDSTKCRATSEDTERDVCIDVTELMLLTRLFLLWQLVMFSLCALYKNGHFEMLQFLILHALTAFFVTFWVWWGLADTPCEGLCTKIIYRKQ